MKNNNENKKKPVVPKPKDMDEFIGGVEEEEFLSNEGRHKKRTPRNALQANVAEDLEKLFEQTKERVGDKLEESVQTISNAFDRMQEKVNPYLDALGEETEKFTNKIRSYWNRFTGA